MKDQTPTSTLEKVELKEVMQMWEQVPKQATTGLLCTGDAPKPRELEENIKVGVGPTLSSSINAPVKQVVDYSFSFWKEAVSSFGSRQTERKLSIPQLTGAVWQACDYLMKAPTTNCIAVGRAITKVAVSVKDVLRELKELKIVDETPEETLDQPPDNEGNSSEGDLGIGDQDDELGACLYPPQDVLTIKAVEAKICSEVHEVQAEVRNLDGSSKSLFWGCETLDYSLKALLFELGSSDDNDLVPLEHFIAKMWFNRIKYWDFMFQLHKS
ncbi:hypothetical protein GIB67_002287 [Kingdonia uniflora]|uniref:Cyclin-D1-binding protein 1-like N-terminal domain-containing protein n=1 Tax=Kingdonia uniflora TaxID=39325 RepID=A0A7J7KX10_9MAGN|nr:hypothetical protein GIB67_002287 [Kingdonia uniflora]